MRFDIITVGSAVIDAFVETGVSEIHKKMCYDIGTKIAVKNLYFATGGGGTNTAVAFSRLGLRTGFLGKVGKDLNAEVVLKELKKENVSFLGVMGKEPTGFSVILDSNQHNRTVLTYKGANDFLSFKEINIGKLKAKWFFFSSMDKISHNTEEKLIEYISKRGLKIVFNPSSYLTKKGVKFLEKILRKTNILILNDEEAKDLVKNKDIFEGLHALGPEIVCVTYGEKGSEVSNKFERVKTKPSKNLKIVEVTGAGDAFAAGFVFGMIKFNDIKKAARIGTLNAESTISKIGAKNGLLTFKELESKL